MKEAATTSSSCGRRKPGKADRSYGNEVARLAGLPLSVIEPAREVLQLHEQTEHVEVEELAHAEPGPGPVQTQMFEPVGYGLAERIRSIYVDQLRPIDALQLPAELQKELKR